MLTSSPHREGISRDPLTDALPKAQFAAGLEVAVQRARASGQPLSLLVIDIDHFKSVNDAFGHTRGDEVLQEFAKRLHASVRTSDILFRFGGDEFALLLPATSKQQALALAQRLLEGVRSRPFPGQPPLTISLSIGAASLPEDTDALEELFKRADLRLYEAKRRGRGQVAGDEYATPAASPIQPVSRLIERDEALESMHGFFHALPAAQRGLLTIAGPRGSGKSRLLDEAKKAAQLLGYEVLSLRGTPALAGRALGVIVEAHQDYEQLIQHGAEAFAEALCQGLQENGKAGLLVAVDDLPHLDGASLDLLRHVLLHPHFPVLAIAATSDLSPAQTDLAPATFLHGTVELRPMSPEGLRMWLRTALQREPTTDFVAWLHEETAGFPSRVQGGISRLVELGALYRTAEGWGPDPGYEKLSLRAWLDARAEARASSIPAVLSSILGRDAEIREAKHLIRTGRLLTLFGPGGFGKTRLAIQVAAELVEEFSNGVFFVSLAAVSSPEFIVPAIAEALRFPFSKELKQQLLQHLRDRQMLLVLDNFEHLIAAAPLVSELLQHAPQLKILATSRESLGLGGETVLHVRGMAVPESDGVPEIQRSPAAQLFVQQAKRHRSGFSPTEDWVSVARICRRLEGIPLAIEIAAALVNVLSCEEILAEIDRDLDALVTSARDAPERHRSLRAVFAYSWNLLSEPERKVWSKLSLFRGGFRRDAAEQVAGASLHLLSSLANKSLLHRTAAGRYEIHEVLRRYAYEKLSEVREDLEHAEASFARYFAEFAYARGERGGGIDSQRLLAETAEEIENLRIGYRWAVERGELAELERFTKGLFQLLDLYGWYQEGKELFGWAADRIRDERLVALALARQGHFCSKLGEAQEAKVLHRKSMAMLRRVGADEESSLSLYNLGTIAYQEGDYEEAERLYRKCVRIYRQTNSRPGLALCLNDLGTIALLQGRYAEAERLFHKSLRIRSELGDEAGKARCLTNLGMIADHLEKPSEARRFFEQSLTAARNAADRKSVAAALNNLGVLARRIGEEERSAHLLEEAKHFLQEALEVYEEIGARTGAALTLYNLGDIACLLNEYETAETYHLEAMRRAATSNAMSLLTSIFVGVAKLLMKTGRGAGAVELLSLVLDHSATMEEDRQTAEQLLAELERGLESEAFRTMRNTGKSADLQEQVSQLSGGVLINRGGGSAPPIAPTGVTAERRASPIDVEEMIREAQAAERSARHSLARACYETALHHLSGPDQASLAASLLRWIGRTHIAEGDLDAAGDCLEASLATAEAHADRSGVAHATNLQGIVLFHRGHLDAATQTYGLARVTAHQAGDARLVAMIDQNLGVIANIQGDLRAALEHYRTGLEGFRSLGMEENTIEALNNLGMLSTDLHDWTGAEEAFAEALRICERTTNFKARVMVEVNQVEMWIEKRDFETARAACDSAFELATRVGDARALGELHRHYGVTYRETNHLHLAEVHLAQAARIAEEREDPLLSAETAREQAELFWHQQRSQQTLQSLNRAHRFFSQLRARRDLAATGRRIEEFESLFLEIVRRWGASIESADHYTQGHCERVADLACALAHATGMDEQTLLWFRMGALLHDVGKIVVPSEILNKPGALTPEERTIIERHPDAGVELLSDIEFPWDIRPMVRHHHERWEGRGYPTGIAGEGIPFSARILCIADVYDALTSDRPYRTGFSHERAIDIMENGMRGHFDPALFPLFKQLRHEQIRDAAAGPVLAFVADGRPQIRLFQVA